MKKIIALLLLSIYLTGVFSIFGYATEDTEKESIRKGSHTLDAEVPVLGTEQLITNAKSAILYEVTTQTLMHAYNADEKMSPASLVKILTALIAIEEGDLASKVIVHSAVLDTVAKDAVMTKFTDGEVVTLEDLLYCMLVDSGNDAAALIADHIAGSQEAFVEMLNAYATELGCKDTNFTNAHGLHNDMQYTTARDMGRIMTAAVANETLCDILGTVYYTVPANLLSEERHLASENLLLNDQKFDYDSRVKGSRTGVANDKSRCIASVAESSGLRFIVIIMGSESVYEENGVKIRSFGGYTETSDLLDLGFDDFSAYQLIYEGQILLQRSVTNGDCAVNLGTKEPAATVLPDGVTMANITIEYDHLREELSAPIQEGEKLSVARYMYGDVCIAEAELFAMNSVCANTEMLVVQKTKTENKMNTALTVVLLVVIGVLLAYLAYMIYRKRRIKTNQQRRHRNKQR